MTQLWLEFILMALFIIISGTYLSRFGDIIADKSGLGQAFIGGILIAMATSLPELVTSISSALVGAPDIAVGNAFGSNTFNLVILAFADLLQGKGPLLLRVNYSHILSGLVGVLLSALVVFSLILSHFMNFNLNVFGVGLDSIILLLTYLVSVRMIYRYDQNNPLDAKDEEKENLNPEYTLNKALLGFAACAVVIVFSGYRLTLTADQISAVTGIDQSFIGSILVAAATSLPELVATISAIRIGAYNMAVGNVFGSNIFNMTVIFFADVFYRQGVLLQDVRIVHILTATVGIVMATIILIGLFYRSRRSFMWMGWDAIAAAVVYFLGVYLLFQLGLNVI
ncbi:MAG: inner membrane protein [Halanaerobium sp. 4-GBenrich]|uniref:Cation:H+ antiporter n=1 Tax=Halanaerobium congolense TaxID=54121 RepID=A0A4R7EJ15_9FIRM|nr:sodium:calcium antiporter [Halanaerobium congolense]ODS49972.1 MAG: inner membrane protein [Halanaerobium sp. 4-GBenrich]TDS33954.1 cation:H+ antiporter [Halanaerobium congolense]